MPKLFPGVRPCPEMSDERYRQLLAEKRALMSDPAEQDQCRGADGKIKSELIARRLGIDLNELLEVMHRTIFTAQPATCRP